MWKAIRRHGPTTGCPPCLQPGPLPWSWERPVLSMTGVRRGRRVVALSLIDAYILTSCRQSAEYFSRFTKSLAADISDRLGALHKPHFRLDGSGWPWARGTSMAAMTPMNGEDSLCPRVRLRRDVELSVERRAPRPPPNLRVRPSAFRKRSSPEVLAGMPGLALKTRSDRRPHRAEFH